jgi:membrane protein DedA with SNARE-associated domain
MFMESFVHWLIVYKYGLLFPLAVVEGPVLAVIVGWLCGAGVLQFVPSFAILIAGDMVGDSGFYLLGRLTAEGHFERFAARIGCGPRKVDRARQWFRENPLRTIAASKITLGVGPVGLFLAGQSRIPYKTFLSVCSGVAALQYFFYLLAGMLLGHGYVLLVHYLSVVSAVGITVAAATLVFLLLRSHFKKL